MKGIVLAVGVGLASLALTESAFAQEPCATAPVVCQPTCTTTTYWHGCWPQSVIPCYQPIQVYYPAYTPTYRAPTYRYVSCRPCSYWTPSYSCRHRVIHWSRGCR
jgi:hypothetical protein